VDLFEFLFAWILHVGMQNRPVRLLERLVLETAAATR
jgi:hypothetical protein